VRLCYLLVLVEFPEIQPILNILRRHLDIQQPDDLRTKFKVDGVIFSLLVLIKNSYDNTRRVIVWFCFFQNFINLVL